MEATNFKNIPKEKFQFANKSDMVHDKKLDTKPVSYLRGALKRFCKNKGSVVAAVIIAILVLFAIIAPFCTQYTVSYNDGVFVDTLPKSSLFAKTNFWDGCSTKELNKEAFTIYYAMGEETGHNAVKNQKYELTRGGRGYKFRLDSYHKAGCIYKSISREEYQTLQQYQNDTGIQVMYPTVDYNDRPINDKENANYYFKTTTASGGKTAIEFDDNGNVIPVYKSHAVGEASLDNYNSLRVKGDGENGVEYEYATPDNTGYNVRINYYEYYIFYHSSYMLDDGIKAPSFLFGTTNGGQDILTCLASGARFSFIFAIIVAIVNMFVGVIYGSIEGYYGGKIDLVMERISDILGAVPFMIVISLLKMHMQGTSTILILFISFFLTGWLGTAGTTRMQFYRFKNQEYVLAARTLGAKDKRLMYKHIFPNALGTLVTSSALAIPSMIYSEVNLSYLGIINLSSGNITSVGTLLAGGQPYLQTYPHIILFPSLFLALLMLSFNLFGNGLRDAFNPSLRGTEG